MIVEDVNFGHERRDDFPPLTRPLLNQGSHGLVPLAVCDRERYYRSLAHADTEGWFRRDYYTACNQVRRRLSEYYPGTNERMFVLCQNVSFMVHSIVHSWPWKKGDRILLTNIEYGPVRQTADFAAEKYGIHVEIVNIYMPCSNDDILAAFQRKLGALKDNPPKLAIVSVIASVPGVYLPVKPLAKVFHGRGIPVVWDGAHVHGHLPPSRLHPHDLLFPFGSTVEGPGGVFITSAHKWGFTARTAAYAYFSPNLVPVIHPIVNGAFQRDPNDPFLEFSWPGTVDFSPLLTIQDGLDALESWGGVERVSRHCLGLAKAIGDTVSGMWKTKVLEVRSEQEVEKDQGTFLVNVQLPNGIHDMEQLPWRIHAKGGPWIPVFVLPPLSTKPEGDAVEVSYWARLSASVINELDDYVTYAKMVLADIQECAGSQV